jgi:hypothetical protein
MSSSLRGCCFSTTLTCWETSAELYPTSFLVRFKPIVTFLSWVERVTCV